MVNYLFWRVIRLLVAALIASIVSFWLLALAPEPPLATRQPKCQDQINHKRKYDLDIYLHYRFTRWFVGWPSGPTLFSAPNDKVGEIKQLKGCSKPLITTFADLVNRSNNPRGVLFGDLGLSQKIQLNQPVLTVILSRLPYTLILMGTSTFFTLFFAMILGIYSAVKQYSSFDKIVTTLAFIGSSLPTFFLAVLAIMTFAISPYKALGCSFLPPSGPYANRDYCLFNPSIIISAKSFLDRIIHLILPCLILTFVSIADWSRFIRSSMLEVLQQDYIRAAYAKGVREKKVIFWHAFRNALIPVVTLVAGIIPNLFGGAVIIETIFNWPGTGRLLIDALGVSDYNVAIAVLSITILLQMVGYLLSDILYTWADPKIRLG